MDRPPLILVVDDDRSTRRVSKKALEQNMYEVVEAENGLAALDAFEKYRPDLVLLDVVMPHMDGYEACRRIRACPAGAAVPIIIITGSVDFEAIGEAYEAGATDFFAKPINKRILRERVRYMLRASQTASQLQQSQELLASAQRAASLGSFFYAPDSSEFKASEEFKICFGPSDKHRAVTWEAFWQTIHPEDQKTLLPLMQKAHLAGACFRQDIRLIGGNDGERFVMLQIDPEKDSGGKVVRLIGIVQDITERKLSELLETDQNYVMQKIVRKEPLKKIFLEAARLLQRQRPQAWPPFARLKTNKFRP